MKQKQKNKQKKTEKEEKKKICYTFPCLQQIKLRQNYKHITLHD